MVTIIAKVTEACNSRCAYCDVVAKANQQTATMNNAVLEQLYVRVNEYLQADSNRNCQIIWHGGEPLLAGIEFFTTALRFYKLHCTTTHQRVQHALQSNLTQMRPEFIPILKQLGINSIGTSYEPIPNIRGPGLDPRSEVYNNQFMRGVQVLDAAGMNWGTIYVVNKRSLADPLGVFHFMTNLNPHSSVMFNPVLIYGEDKLELAITPEEYVDFLGAIFPTWWQRRERYHGCNPFQLFVDNIINGQQSLGCADSGKCYTSHLNITPDGATSQCGRAGDWGLLNYGSIFDISFDAILNHPQRQVLKQRDATLLETDCAGCKFWPICHGGCPLDSWAITKSFLHKTPWCYAKRGFIEKYFEPITGVRYQPKLNELEVAHD